jgi:hypothetical protein
MGTDTSARANLGACPGSNGHGSNIWVLGPNCTAGGNTGEYIINVYWSDQHGRSGASSLQSGGAIGAQATVPANPASSCWQFVGT